MWRGAVDYRRFDQEGAARWCQARQERSPCCLRLLFGLFDKALFLKAATIVIRHRPP
jgi:hypothetical protein